MTIAFDIETGKRFFLEGIPSGGGDTSNLANKDLSNLNNNGKIYISHLGKPSSTKYTNLGTSTASGTVLTAPSDGYVFARCTISANTITYLELINLTTGLGSTGVYYQAKDVSPLIFIPVAKNQTFQCNYNNSGGISFYKFVYSIGSESEAS